MRKVSVYLFAAALTLSLVSFSVFQQKDNTLTSDEKKQGWILLFDGESTKGWKGYKGREQEGWVVQNGELVCKEDDIKKRADLLTVGQYDNYELLIDWKIAPKHNSGIIYRCTEENGASFESGPEYQLIDDINYPGKLSDKQLSGANYDMHAPSSKVSKPAGEFNTTKIVVNRGHVEHWLNGVKVVEYEFWTPEWDAVKAQSKWKDVKPYGMAKTGHIALQDHGGGVSFKNVKIKPIK